MTESRGAEYGPESEAVHRETLMVFGYGRWMTWGEWHKARLDMIFGRRGGSDGGRRR